MTRQELDDIWAALRDGYHVLVLCDQAEAVRETLFGWLRGLGPLYEGPGELLLPNDTWVILLVDSAQARAEAARVKKTGGYKTFILT